MSDNETSSNRRFALLVGVAGIILVAVGLGPGKNKYLWGLVPLWAMGVLGIVLGAGLGIAALRQRDDSDPPTPP